MGDGKSITLCGPTIAYGFPPLIRILLPNQRIEKSDSEPFLPGAKKLIAAAAVPTTSAARMRLECAGGICSLDESGGALTGAPTCRTGDASRDMRVDYRTERACMRCAHCRAVRTSPPESP